jgi:hypothetical protein
LLSRRIRDQKAVARYAGLIGIKFAHDSLLEGDGFELPVPVRQAKLTRFCR